MEDAAMEYAVGAMPLMYQVKRLLLGIVAMECRNGDLALIRKSRTVMSVN